MSNVEERALAAQRAGSGKPRTSVAGNLHKHTKCSPSLSHFLRHPPSQTRALHFPGSDTNRHAAKSDDVCSATGFIRSHGISPRHAAERRQRCMCVRSYGKLLPKSSGIFSPLTSRPPSRDESAAGSRARQDRKKSYSREVVAHSGRVKFQRCSTATKTWRVAAAHGWNRSSRTCDTKASVSSSL